jgi:hypothetical protein
MTFKTTIIGSIKRGNEGHCILNLIIFPFKKGTSGRWERIKNDKCQQDKHPAQREFHSLILD